MFVQWADQHDNATCEQYKRWLEENDPDFQREGLARHLQENGIGNHCARALVRSFLSACYHLQCIAGLFRFQIVPNVR